MANYIIFLSRNFLIILGSQILYVFQHKMPSRFICTCIFLIKTFLANIKCQLGMLFQFIILENQLFFSIEESSMYDWAEKNCQYHHILYP